MLKWVGLGVLVSLLSLAAYVFVYTKAYQSPELENVTIKDLHLFYTEHMGPYHLIDPKIREVEKEAIRLGFSCIKTFGHFLDDPQHFEEDRLRAEVGCWLSGPLPEASQIGEGFRYEHRPGGEFLKITWTGSPAIGPIKVYPAARSWFEKERLVFPTDNFEVYETVRGGQLITTYYFAIQKQ